MNKWLCILMALCAGQLNAQISLTLSVSPSTLTVVPAVHSGAFGIYNGKWFMIGGRKNGLHGFQPPFAFPVDNINDSIFIIDPATNQQWATDVYSLPQSVWEPITSSNMEFYLQDSTLYMVGGYGWKDSLQDFVTWPLMTAINMKGLMNAVINQQPITPYFRQYYDSALAVCGSHLTKLDSTYYLVFGHRFDGTYDKTDSSGIFVQTYTDEIRRFQIADDGTNLSIYNYSPIRDTDNFHRRDYNLLPQIYPYGQKGFLAFSGVFQKGTKLPYLTPIEVFDTAYHVRSSFNQNLSQYHSAFCMVYDSMNNLQHNIFFGGLSMYYLDTLTGNMVTDSMVPFVNTISDVVRDVDDNLFEFNTGVRMPALLGTNAYFFVDTGAPLINGLFINANAIRGRQRIGYITGGIKSPDLNISQTDPTLSTASHYVFEVFLTDSNSINTSMALVSNPVLNFFCFPNPAKQSAEIQFELTQLQKLKIELLDMSGKLVMPVCNRVFSAGKQKLRLDVSGIASGVYNCVITVNQQRKSIRLAKD